MVRISPPGPEIKPWLGKLRSHKPCSTARKKKRKDFPLYPIFNANSLKNSKSVIDQITDQSKSVIKFALLKDYPGFRVARTKEDARRSDGRRSNSGKELIVTWTNVVTVGRSMRYLKSRISW